MRKTSNAALDERDSESEPRSQRRKRARRVDDHEDVVLAFVDALRDILAGEKRTGD